MARRAGPKRRTAYTDDVLEILYRQGGLTIDQVAGWLSILYPEIAERDAVARAQRAMIHPDDRPKRWGRLPSYYAARQVLAALEDAGEVEPIRIRRTWLDGAASVGRLESFYRLSLTANQAAALEAGVVAGVEDDEARQGYRRNWSGGAISHTAQRSDLLAILCRAGLSTDGNGIGAVVDLDTVWGESNPDYPLVGAKLEAVDAAGKKKYDYPASGRGKQKPSQHTGRKYERVVPDAELIITIFPNAIEPPVFDTPDDDRFRRAPEPSMPEPDHDYEDDDEGWQDVETSGSNGEVHA